MSASRTQEAVCLFFFAQPETQVPAGNDHPCLAAPGVSSRHSTVRRRRPGGGSGCFARTRSEHATIFFLRVLCSEGGKSRRSRWAPAALACIENGVSLQGGVWTTGRKKGRNGQGTVSPQNLFQSRRLVRLNVQAGRQETQQQPHLPRRRSGKARIAW